jgi:hypothetical protein
VVIQQDLKAQRHKGSTAQRGRNTDHRLPITQQQVTSTQYLFSMSPEPCVVRRPAPITDYRLRNIFLSPVALSSFNKYLYI